KKQSELSKFTNQCEKQISSYSQEIDVILDRLTRTTNETLIKAYEEKIERLEKKKLVQQERLIRRDESKDSFGTAILKTPQPHGLTWTLRINSVFISSCFLKIRNMIMKKALEPQK